MSDVSEFQVCGAATEKAHRVNSVRVLAADSSGASEDRRGRTGTAGWIRSFRYAGVDDESTLNVSVAILSQYYTVIQVGVKQFGLVQHILYSNQV